MSLFAIVTPELLDKGPPGVPAAGANVVVLRSPEMLERGFSLGVEMMVRQVLVRDGVVRVSANK